MDTAAQSLRNDNLVSVLAAGICTVAPFPLRAVPSRPSCLCACTRSLTAMPVRAAAQRLDRRVQMLEEQLRESEAERKSVDMRRRCVFAARPHARTRRLLARRRRLRQRCFGGRWRCCSNLEAESRKTEKALREQLAQLTKDNVMIRNRDTQYKAGAPAPRRLPPPPPPHLRAVADVTRGALRSTSSASANATWRSCKRSCKSSSAPKAARVSGGGSSSSARQRSPCVCAQLRSPPAWRCSIASRPSHVRAGRADRKRYGAAALLPPGLSGARGCAQEEELFQQEVKVYEERLLSLRGENEQLKQALLSFNQKLQVGGPCARVVGPCVEPTAALAAADGTREPGRRSRGARGACQSGAPAARLCLRCPCPAFDRCPCPCACACVCVCA
jgi:hypothetical protein